MNPKDGTSHAEAGRENTEGVIQSSGWSPKAWDHSSHNMFYAKKTLKIFTCREESSGSHSPNLTLFYLGSTDGFAGFKLSEQIPSFYAYISYCPSYKKMEARKAEKVSSGPIIAMWLPTIYTPPAHSTSM